MGRRPSLTYRRRNDPDTRTDAIGRCETIRIGLQIRHRQFRKAGETKC